MNKKQILKKYTGKGGPILNKVGSVVRGALINNPVGKATRAIANTYYDIKANRAKNQADKDVAAIKLARSYDNAPNRNEDGSVSDAFKARAMADEVRDRISSKFNKK